MSAISTNFTPRIFPSSVPAIVQSCVTPRPWIVAT